MYGNIGKSSQQCASESGAHIKQLVITGRRFTMLSSTLAFPEMTTSWSPHMVKGLAELPVFGYPGPLFYVLHILAVICLSISILTSSAVLFYFLRSDVHFFKRSIGERLVVYLAISDLLFSVSHEMDHSYMLATTDHPPEAACRTFAFFVQGLMLAQAMIVSVTSLSTMMLVVFQKKLHLGRCDWRLLSLTIVPPIGIGIGGVVLPYLGQSGMW